MDSTPAGSIAPWPLPSKAFWAMLQALRTAAAWTATPRFAGRACWYGLLLALSTGLAQAQDDGPRVPCGAAPYPAYAEPGAAPNLRAWSGKAARGWAPPACSTWKPVDADVMVALAGSFRYEGGIDGLLARIGAISAKKGVRYWSTTEKNWQLLVTDAFALSGPEVTLRRADFKAAEMGKGAAFHYAQSDNRSAGNTVYRERVLASEAERVLIESENLTPIKKLMVTLYSPGDLQTLYVIEPRAPGVWNFYSLTRTRMASSMLPTGSEASYINRSVAFYRYVAGIPTDKEPPGAR